MAAFQINERRVYRQIAFPVSAFSVLQGLKRAWSVETNGEVLTRLLLTAGRTTLMENDESERSSSSTAN